MLFGPTDEFRESVQRWIFGTAFGNGSATHWYLALAQDLLHAMAQLWERHGWERVSGEASVAAIGEEHDSGLLDAARLPAEGSCLRRAEGT